MKRVKIKETNLNFNGLYDRAATEFIVIHHTGCKDIDASAPQIHEWHLDNGWAGIGYHFVVRKDGTIERGRPVNTIGSHAGGFNSYSIGIHLSGDFSYAYPTDAQIESTALLLANLCTDYGIEISRSNIIGHCDLMSTDCPGTNLYSQLQILIDKAAYYARSNGEDISIAKTSNSVTEEDTVDVNDIAVLARKYESNNDPATISNIKGDVGGMSYGLYQFSSAVGSVNEFLDWLRNYPDDAYANYGRVLCRYEINSDEFQRTWHDIGTIDWGGFSKLQDEYVKAKYYDVAAKKLAEKNFHIAKHSIALKAVLFARAVQNGVGRIVPLFEHATKIIGQPNMSYIDDAYFDGSIIEAIYKFLREECANVNVAKDGIYRSPYDFVHGGYAVTQALASRFLRERDDAMTILIRGSLTN